MSTARPARGPARVDFTARQVVDGDPADVFAVLVDWPRQTAWVPLTTVTRLPGPVGAPGERFVGRTGLGPLRFDDPMTVTRLDPPAAGGPGVVEVRKTGTALGGDVRIVVRADRRGRSVVEWTERVLVHPRALAALARATGPLAALAGRLAFTVVLRAARPDLAAGPGARP